MPSASFMGLSLDLIYAQKNLGAEPLVKVTTV